MIATGTTIEVDGLKTRYLEEGSGPVLLLLHGNASGSTADVYTPTMSQLADYGLRVIAFDLPGYGGTDNPPENSQAFRADFNLKFMDALGIDKATVVGHSGSGTPALLMTFAHPERVSGMVVLGTGSVLPTLPEGNSSGEVSPKGPLPTIDEMREVMKDQLYNHALITEEMLQFRVSVARPRLPGTAPQPGGGGGTPMWQRLADLPVPLLLIYGENDRNQAAERFHLLKERVPSLNMHLLERCRHIIHLDRPEAFVKLVGEFAAANG
jgi:2-hydroxy-6-oxonona-2,4-dienedioate hydrolase